MRIDVLIKLLEKLKEEHGNLAVCVDDGKSDMLWNILLPKVSEHYPDDGTENIVVISPER